MIESSSDILLKAALAVSVMVLLPGPGFVPIVTVTSTCPSPLASVDVIDAVPIEGEIFTVHQTLDHVILNVTLVVVSDTGLDVVAETTSVEPPEPPVPC